MNGHEASERLKDKMGKKEMKYIPIIANSANTTELAEYLPDYFDDMIPKPIKKEILFEIIN